MLSAQNVVKSFGGFRALNGCNLEIRARSITGIIGPNGAGKSTLFNILTGLMPADEGSVSLEGRSIARRRPDQLAALGLVRTFQISRELGELTVLENMLLGEVASERRARVAELRAARARASGEKSGRSRKRALCSSRSISGISPTSPREIFRAARRSCSRFRAR